MGSTKEKSFDAEWMRYFRAKTNATIVVLVMATDLICHNVA